MEAGTFGWGGDLLGKGADVAEGRRPLFAGRLQVEAAAVDDTVVRTLVVVLLAAVLSTIVVAGAAPASVAVGQLARIDHVADGDTVDLTNGAKVRLVQIDTPEVYFSPECYGKRASAITKRLLPPGTRVRLTPEPKTDSIDSYGRLLRYVTRVRDGLNINVQLVRIGAAAPYFYDYRRGRYAPLLVRLGLRARDRRIGLWGRCPDTPWDPNHGVSTGPPR